MQYKKSNPKSVDMSTKSNEYRNEKGSLDSLQIVYFWQIRTNLSLKIIVVDNNIKLTANHNVKG